MNALIERQRDGTEPLSTWIRLSREGSLEAFARFYDATAPWLLKRVRNGRHHRPDEEVLAHAYQDAWNKAADFDSTLHEPLAWLESLLPRAVIPGADEPDKNFEEPTLTKYTPRDIMAGEAPGTASEKAADMPARSVLRDNRLLAMLPASDLHRWAPRLELVELPLGEVLYDSGVELSHAYFPTTCIVSLLYVLENGASAEIAMAGNEGLVGVSLFMGGLSTSSRAVVQSAGQAFRLPYAVLMEEFNEAGPAMRLLLRYTQALITQMSQTAVCNRHHTLEQQLCRWLLLSLDRLEGNELVMTQELIANMLGVRREGVTEAASKLQREGVIRYARGHITVLERESVERCACECYTVVRKEYDRLLSGQSIA